MSDQSVCAALRSNSPFVLIEAPAGCGKTYCGAEYAKEAAKSNPSHRLLVLTHTHAAVSVFAERTQGIGSRVEIRTIDSVVAQVAAAYHRSLGLPSDISTWVREDDSRHPELALKVARLLKKHPMIAMSLAKRYQIVICDEHQDSSGDQHSIAMSLHREGTKLRVFGDPMQKIFRDKETVGGFPSFDWEELSRQAQVFEQLDQPHRWSDGCRELGQWTLEARAALKAGNPVGLRGSLPPSVKLAFAENRSQKFGEYQVSPQDRKQIDAFEGATKGTLLILTRHNPTARSLRSFFNRRIQLWEGHMRVALDKLVRRISAAKGNPTLLAGLIIEFMGDVGVGFSPTAFGNRFQKEVGEGCVKPTRGAPALIQELAKTLLLEPDHCGIGNVLHRIWEFTKNEQAFSTIKIDHRREFWEAILIGKFDTPEKGFAEITHRRTYTRPKPPERAISTIHKAKGLECDGVIVMPCDKTTFPNSPEARCLLYVALSRAKSRLMIVLSRDNPSPLFVL